MDERRSTLQDVAVDAPEQQNTLPAEEQAAQTVAASVEKAAPNPNNIIDEQTVAAVLSGRTEAFAEIVERYKTAVFNLCARMLGDPDEAEDAAQEVFLRAYNQLASYQSGRRFSTWLLSIASHYCIDILRRRRPTTDIDNIAFLIKSDQPEPEDVALTGETRREVRAILQKLPEKYRTVTILRYFYDMSYEEIADNTGLTVGTVKTRLFRARALLADLITQQRSIVNAGGSASLPEPKPTRARRSRTAPTPLPAPIPIDSRDSSR